MGKGLEEPKETWTLLCGWKQAAAVAGGSNGGGGRPSWGKGEEGLPPAEHVRAMWGLLQLWAVSNSAAAIPGWAKRTRTGVGGGDEGGE